LLFCIRFQIYTAAGKEASTHSPLQPPLHRQWYILKAMAAYNNDENNVNNNDVKNKYTLHLLKV